MTDSQRSVQLSLVAEVTNAWLTLAADQARLQLTQETLRSREASYSLTERTYRLGGASGLVLAQKLVAIFHLMDLNQFYTLLFCLWFLLLGVIEYLVLRFIWRRWFSLAD